MKMNKISKRIVAVCLIMLVLIAASGCSFAEDLLNHFHQNESHTIKFCAADPDFSPTDAQFEEAIKVLEIRLDYSQIFDRTIKRDAKNNILIKFNQTNKEEAFDLESIIEKLTAIGQLTFAVVEQVENPTVDSYDFPQSDGFSANYIIKEKLMDNSHIKKAEAGFIDGNYVIELEFTDEGGKILEDATKANLGKTIGIFMDNTLITTVYVGAAITENNCYIEGGFNAETAQDLASKINSDVLPFALETIFAE